MIRSPLIWGWVAVAVAVLFLLLLGASWYRARLTKPLVPDRRLLAAGKALRRSRIVSLVLGLAAGIALALSSAGNHYGAALAAPAVWGLFVILGAVATDLLVIGHHRFTSQPHQFAYLKSATPWKLVGLLVALTVIMLYAMWWAAGASDPGGRSNTYTYDSLGTHHSVTADFFPGSFYSYPFLQVYPWMLILAVAGIVVASRREPFLPEAKYAGFDQGFKRRAIRDVVFACIGATSGAIALTGLGIAYGFALGASGPGTPERSVVAGLSMVACATGTGLFFWAMANLVTQPVLQNIPDLGPTDADRWFGDTGTQLKEFGHSVRAAWRRPDK